MKEIAKVFTKLGFLGFGGPLATISMMEDECVSRRHWCSEEDFARTFSLIKIFPGPLASQMSVHLGRVRAGRIGGVVAGLCFTLPSFFMILLLGILLGRLGNSPYKESFVTGMQVAALGVIFQGAWRLAQANVKLNKTVAVALLSMSIVFVKPGLEPLVILFFGVFGILTGLRPKAKLEVASFLILIWVCVKAALLTFGSGLAIVPLLEHDVVEKYGWLTHSQFLEALALGQITPGPVVITVTWIGYQVMKLPGALVATFFVFLPGFLMSLFTIPAVEKKWGGSLLLARFYQFVIPAVVGAMFAVTFKLITVTVKGPVSFGILGASLVLVFWRKTPAWIVIPMLGLICVGLTQLEGKWLF